MKPCFIAYLVPHSTFSACNVTGSLQNENNMVFCVSFGLQRTLLPAPGSRGPGQVSLCCCVATFCMLLTALASLPAWVLAILAAAGTAFVVPVEGSRFGCFHCSCSTSGKKEMWGSEAPYKQSSSFYTSVESLRINNYNYIVVFMLS